MTTSANDEIKEEEGPPAKRFKPDYSNNLLTVLVGPECKEFVIHKASLCLDSAFFRATCNRIWERGQKRVIRLGEVDADTFEVYVHWVYSGALDMGLMTEPKQLVAESIATPSYWNLGKVWILANSLGNHALSNHVVDFILKKLDSHPSEVVDALSLKYLFSTIPKGSKIRQLLLDVMSAKVDGEWIAKWEKEVPFAVILELAKRYASDLLCVWRPPVPKYADRCKYHFHGEGEAKCK